MLVYMFEKLAVFEQVLVIRVDQIRAATSFPPPLVAPNDPPMCINGAGEGCLVVTQ